MLGGSGQRRGVSDFDEVVGHGLDDLVTAPDVGVGQVPLESVMEGPVHQGGLLLEFARGGGLDRFARLDPALGEFPLGARVANRGGMKDQVEWARIVCPAVRDHAGGVLVERRHVVGRRGRGSRRTGPRGPPRRGRGRPSARPHPPPRPDRERPPARRDRLPGHGSRPGVRSPAKGRRRSRVRPALPPAVPPPRRTALAPRTSDSRRSVRPDRFPGRAGSRAPNAW